MSTRLNEPFPKLERVDANGSQTSSQDVGPVVPGEHDIASNQKRTLGSYMSSLSMGKAPDTGISEFNGQVPHRNAFPIPSDGPTPTFTAPPGSSTLALGLNDYSNSGKFDSSPGGLDGIISKGELGNNSGRQVGSGHELLTKIVGSVEGGVVTTAEGSYNYATRIAKILEESNPQHPGGKVSGPSGVSSTPERRLTTGDRFKGSSRSVLGGKLGRFSGSPGPASSQQVDVSVLRDVAIDMMLNATGKNQGHGVPGGTVGSSVEPSTVQQGIGRVDSFNMRPAMYAQLPDDFNATVGSRGQDQLAPEDIEGAESKYSDKSVGVVYSPLEPYLGATSSAASFTLLFGIFTAAILASAAAIGETIKASAALSIPKTLNPFEGTVNQSAGIAGLYVPTNVYATTANKPGVGAYLDCAIVGLTSFLGANQDIDLNNPIVSFRSLSVGASLLDPRSRGYYHSVFRSVAKDAVNWRAALGAIESLTISFGSLSFIGVLDTLVRIGDTVYKIQAARLSYTLDADGEIKALDPAVFENSDQKAQREFAARRITGEKITGGDGKSAPVSYAMGYLPALHLVPDGAGQIYGTLLDKSNNKKIGITKHAGKNRFTPEQVSTIESVLDAEYMPFYFQDLRTNEVIPFHAFIDELSDSYSVEFEKASGYGRLDDVQMYRKTKRSVSLAFHVVSTNDDDFDYMWWQINKLTTLAYPQWSAGTRLTSDNIKFTQPFSQIMTASPIIRIRLGDLIRSNYSRFNLKRTFGYQDTENQQVTDSAALSRVNYEVIDPISTAIIKEDGTVGDSINLGKGTRLSLDNFRLQDFKLEDGKRVRIYDLSKIKSISSSEAINAQGIDSFYDPQKNAVIRSFESSMGLGLAAVITQLQFTWLDDKTMWGAGDDGPGNRAPRSCRIQLSLDPIHDIPPGLDSDGFNRAPLYPVGRHINSIIEGVDASPYGATSGAINGRAQRETIKGEIPKSGVNLKRDGK